MTRLHISLLFLLSVLALPACDIDLGKDEVKEERVAGKDKCDDTEEYMEGLEEDCEDGDDDACDDLEETREWYDEDCEDDDERDDREGRRDSGHKSLGRATRGARLLHDDISFRRLPGRPRRRPRDD